MGGWSEDGPDEDWGDWPEDWGDWSEDEEAMARRMFADPGGGSALRGASRSNPRDRPCPSCGRRDRLTPADVALGYQCDDCADALERGWGP